MRQITHFNSKINSTMVPNRPRANSIISDQGNTNSGMIKVVTKMGSIENRKYDGQETSMHLNIGTMISKKKRSAMDFKIHESKEIRGNSSPDMALFDEHQAYTGNQ